MQPAATVHLIKAPKFIFQLIPKLLPRFIKKKEALAKFDDEEYVREIEDSFKLRFVENLEVRQIVDILDNKRENSRSHSLFTHSL